LGKQDKAKNREISNIGEKKSRNKPLFTLIITVLALSVLIVYLSYIGIDEVAGVLLGANLWLLGLSIILIYISLFMDFLVWYDMLRRVEPKTKLFSSFRIYLMAFTIGYMIPSAGASNVAARSWMCSKEKWGKTCGGPKVLSTIMAHTLIGFVTFAVSVIIALVGLYFVFHVSFTVLLILIVLLAVLLFIVIELMIIFTNSKKLIHLIEKLHRFLKKVPILKNHTSLLEDIDDKIISLTKNFSYFFKNRKLFLYYFSIVMFSRVIIWLAIYVALLSIGLDMIPFMLVVIASIIIMLLAFIPLGIPGMTGIKEVVLSEIFILAPGMNDRIMSGAAGIISNVDFYFTVIVGAVLYVLWSLRHRRN